MKRVNMSTMGSGFDGDLEDKCIAMIDGHLFVVGRERWLIAVVAAWGGLDVGVLRSAVGRPWGREESTGGHK